MRHIVQTGLAASIALALSGCHSSRWYNGRCETDAHCAMQAGFGKACVYGQCKECGVNEDCKRGFACRGTTCVPRPGCERPEDCPAGTSCASGACVAPVPSAPSAGCTTDDACGAGKACRAGRCVPARLATCPVGGGKLMAIYFGHDQALLTPESEEALSMDADCIKALGFKEVTIDGNCDPRGSAEYNFRLGQRRAEAARKYLMHLGVDPDSIRTTSSGESRPVCAGQEEGCWQANRRDDIRAQ